MIARSFVAALVALCCAACKKPQPSPAFQEAVALKAELYAQKLDDAYVAPEMEEVERLLRAVPENSSDHALAQEMLKNLASERARVTEETAARRASVAAALKPLPTPADSRPAASLQLEAKTEVDAGLPQPQPGTPLARFVAEFGGCFEAWESVDVAGRGKVDTYALKNIANCRDRHPGFDEQLLLFEGGKLYARAPKSSVRTEWRYPDGGTK